MMNAVTSAQPRIPVRAGRPSPSRPSAGGLPRSRVAASALAQLESARRGLAEAADESAPAARYVAAQSGLAPDQWRQVWQSRSGESGKLWAGTRCKQELRVANKFAITETNLPCRRIDTGDLAVLQYEILMLR